MGSHERCQATVSLPPALSLNALPAPGTAHLVAEDMISGLWARRQVAVDLPLAASSNTLATPVAAHLDAESVTTGLLERRERWMSSSLASSLPVLVVSHSIALALLNADQAKSSLRERSDVHFRWV